MSSMITTAESPSRALGRETAAPAAMLSQGVMAAATALSLVAAVIHLRVGPEHLEEWWGYGAFFFASAVAELGYVFLLARRPHGWVLQAGIWMSLGTVLMYLVSRTAGIPLGPERGAVEEVEFLGVAATLSEAALVVLLCGLLTGTARRRTLNAMALLGAALWVASFTGALSPADGAAIHSHTHSHSAHNAAYPYGEGPVPTISDELRNQPRPWGDG